MAIPYSRTLIGGLPWYSVLVVTGIAVAVWLAGREEKRLGLPGDTAVDLALIVVPCGIIGARAYYVAMSWQQFAAHPVSALYVWQGGLAIYGGVIGGALGTWLYARRKKLLFAALADMIAPGLLLAQAIGRWGNYFNMEAYGPEIVDARFQFFPLGVLIPQQGTSVWHMATFFYESVWNLLGFAVLWKIRKKQRCSGHVFAWYLILYGSGRFVIEQLRQDSLYVGGLRASQWLSLFLCAVAAGVVLYQRNSVSKRHRWLALGCAAVWLLRWACLQNPWLYGTLMLGAGVAAVWLLRNQKSLALLVTVLVLDALGLAVSLCGQQAALLHAFLCSASLPGYLIALHQE